MTTPEPALATASRDPPPWRTSGSVELVVNASPADVYAVVADMTRIGEHSPECHRAAWLSGTPAGTVGASFRRSNRSGFAARWSRRCEVVAADPARAFALRTVPERLDLSRRDSTTWRYDLEPVDGGTRVTHSYEITWLSLPPMRALFPHHRDMRRQMLANLEALRDQFAGYLARARAGGAPTIRVSGTSRSMLDSGECRA